MARIEREQNGDRAVWKTPCYAKASQGILLRPIVW